MKRREAIATARMAMATTESVEMEMNRIDFELDKLEQEEGEE
jgi:hypothetical protein